MPSSPQLVFSDKGLVPGTTKPVPIVFLRGSGSRLEVSRAAGDPEGVGLTVDVELEVLGLLARWAEGCALVPPCVPRVAAGDPEDLAILPELDARVSQEDSPGDTSSANSRSLGSKVTQATPEGRQAVKAQLASPPTPTGESDQMPLHGPTVTQP